MSRPPQILQYVLAYLFWVITILLGVACFLVLPLTVRNTLPLLSNDPVSDRYMIDAIVRFFTFLLGFLVVILMVVSEHLYRTGVPKQKLGTRVCQIMFILFLLLGIAHTIDLVRDFFVLGIIGPISIGTVLAELLIAAACWWGRRRLA